MTTADGTTGNGQTARARIGPVGTWLGAAMGSLPAGAVREAAAEVETLGYGALWYGEATKESFSLAGVLLAATREIVIGSGISSIWARDAAAMNGGANTLGEAYPGRFLLGLGVSHQHAVDARGHTYRRPVSMMRDYLDAMDATPYRGPQPPAPVTRVLAALRPRMLELARDRADGAHPYFVPVEHTRRAREALGADAFLAPEQAVVLQTDPDRARAAAREHTSFYLAAPNYVNNLRWLGFTDDDFTDGGSDRLVDAVVAWGDEQAIRDRVRAHLDAGAQPRVHPAAGTQPRAGHGAAPPARSRSARPLS